MFREGPGGPASVMIVTAIGVGQILGWGSAFYLMAVIARPVAEETGWAYTTIISGHMVSLLIAGLVAPRVGRVIESFGGRGVLAFASLLMAAGHLLLSLSQGLLTWYAAWSLLGLAMACGLYDAAFSTLGQIYGVRARSAITNVTLFGGLASTICWPFTAFMIADFGWRQACLAFAAIHLFLMLPMHLRCVPRAPATDLARPRDDVAQDDGPATFSRLFLLLAIILAIAAAVTAIISVHLIAILQGRGLSLASAVATGALFGPAQVAARVLERMLGGRIHPIWTLVISILLTCVGLVLLGLETDPSWIVLALILYGAGNGINSIAKGTVPLALFGPRYYARIMGRLALPQLIIQALAPVLVAFLMDRAGSDAALHVLAALTLANCAGVIMLVRITKTQRAPP